MMAEVMVNDAHEERELDDVTLARARRGDADARLALVRCYERRVFAAITRIAAQWVERRKDLAQETFLRVFRALPEFSPSGPARLSTWIVTIATRLTIDELRKRKPTVQWTGSDAVPSEVEARWTVGGAPLRELGVRERPDARLERRRLGASIEQALAELRPVSRAIVVLRDYHGLSYEEIARAVDVDAAAVASRLFRARRILRKRLTEMGWNV